MQGIGPAFKLLINLENTSSDTPSSNLLITFHYDHTLYMVAKPMIEVRLDFIDFSDFFIMYPVANGGYAV